VVPQRFGSASPSIRIAQSQGIFHSLLLPSLDFRASFGKSYLAEWHFYGWKKELVAAGQACLFREKPWWA
jgi:hypothetical protein